MSKKILLILGNYFPEPTGIGKYNGEMVDWLSSHGYSCTVITTFPYYPQWQVQSEYISRSLWYKKEIRTISESASPICIIRVPHYVPKHPSGIKRILSDFTFFFSSYIVLLIYLFKKKHNYVMTVAPPFQVGLLAIIYKKIKGASFLYHIQDLQIDAARDLNMIKSRIALKLLFLLEEFILKNANKVSTISIGMLKKVRDKCGKKITLCPNWVDVKKFFPVMEKENLKSMFGFKKTDFIVLYSGAIGEKQGLESILYAAKNLQHLQSIKFVICGSGPYKEKLELLKQQLGLNNLIFFPLQPLENFNNFLNLANVHLVLQKTNASDLVMPSKLTTILAVGGLAIVTAPPNTSLYNIISDNNLGLAIEPENQVALETTIKNCMTDTNKRISINARMYAEKYLTIGEILSEYFEQTVNESVSIITNNEESFISSHHN